MTSASTVNQIEIGITESIGSPSQGTPTSSTQATLMNIVLRMIEDGQIGFEALVKNFQDRATALAPAQTPTPSDGAIEKNTGATQKAGTIQVDLILGKPQIAAIAKEAGIPTEEVAAELIEILPKIIDKFTPDGKMPDAATVRQAASLLRTKIS